MQTYLLYMYIGDNKFGKVYLNRNLYIMQQNYMKVEQKQAWGKIVQKLRS